ncbi:MAG TPA: energy transducer TonB [Bryobacteraceae bacterium]|nr:energy transducer TonB [Bryobacteraceae bacterium]
MEQKPDQKLLFGSEIDPPLGWRSYATSFGVHVGAVILLLLIPVAVTQREEIRKAVTLIAPPLKTYKPPLPKVKPKLLAKTEVPKQLPKMKPFVAPKPVVPPPVAKETPKPIEAPHIAAAAPKPAPQIVTSEPKPAPALRPQVHTGVFASEQAAKRVADPKKVDVGGFGDPNGVKANPDAKQPTLLAKVGGFDRPMGEGDNGGHGGQGRGVVRSTSFGSVDGSGSGTDTHARGTVQTGGFGAAEMGNGTGGHGRSGKVATGGFGDNTTTVEAQPVQRPKVQAPATTPVEILSKPKPVYTQEARNLHLEGEVSIQVVFTASGSVKVLRIIRGLGHGLDQAAEQAASRIRFHPGTRDGTPVDTTATVHIVFELT